MSEPMGLLLTVILCLISFQIGRYYECTSSSCASAMLRGTIAGVEGEGQWLSATLPRRRKVYIDIGANNGDSFLKCKKFGIPGMCEDGTWEIVAVEGNPAFNDVLRQKRQMMLNKKLVSSIKLYNGTALYTTDRATVDFAIDRSKPGMGSSLAPESLLFRNKIANNKPLDIIKLPTTTIHSIFEGIAIQLEDFVVVKIDVEGFEYKLLPYLIIHGLLHRIDVLAVEYHDTNVWFYKGLSDERQIELHEQTKCLKWMVSKADRVKQYLDWE
jgi:FkbM family methyltransferase